MQPLVSLSRRCTTPGRCGCAPDESFAVWCRSALTSVPVQLPVAGCTTNPGGLFRHTRSSSSYKTSIGMFSGCASPWSSPGGGSCARTSSPGRNRSEDLAVEPLIVTKPAAMERCHRARLMSGHSSANQRSRRSPGLPAILWRISAFTAQTLEGNRALRKVCRCDLFRASLTGWTNSPAPR